MLSILASGALVSDPKQRTSTNGKPYVTACVRVPAEDSEAVMLSVIAFAADAVQALSALTKGDSCAIAGRAKLSDWEKDGEQRHGLSVVADNVLTPYALDKKRRAVGSKAGSAENSQGG